MRTKASKISTRSLLSRILGEIEAWQKFVLFPGTMGFFYNSKGHEQEPKQKLNAYNVLILLALAPGSICYGYTAAIIATTLGMSCQQITE